ncbi:TPA: YSIRK-type signal peptide-containing protein [Streptococcus pyogenes]
MTRKNTNKQYSLRKLKKGTASVAVALCVLGAGISTHSDVKADASGTTFEAEMHRNEDIRHQLTDLKNQVQQVLNSLNSEGYDPNSISHSVLSGGTPDYLKSINDWAEEALKTVNGQKGRTEVLEVLAKTLEEVKDLEKAIKEKEAEVNSKEKAIKEKVVELATLNDKLTEKGQTLDSSLGVIADQTKKIETLDSDLAKEKANKDELKRQLEDEKKKAEADRQRSEDEKKQLQGKLADKDQLIDDALRVINEKKAELHNLDLVLGEEHSDNIELRGQLEEAKRQAEADRQRLEDEKKQLQEQLANKDQIIDGALRTITEKETELRDLDSTLGKEHLDNIDLKHQLEEEQRQAEEQLKSLEDEKAALEAKLEEAKLNYQDLADVQNQIRAKLEDENARLSDDNAKLSTAKQILEASRTRTNRDLDAARDAKKATEAKLADANAKVSQLQEEKQILEASRTRTNRDLEASRAAKQKVEAELEAAKAEVAALKEQLAKQAEDMAKKPEMPEAPEVTPEAPAAPEKETMDAHKLVPATKVVKDDKKADGKAAPVAKSETKAATNQLPSTGETANPFFTAAAMAVMATAGVVAVAKRKEEN